MLYASLMKGTARVKDMVGARQDTNYMGLIKWGYEPIGHDVL